MNYLLDTNMLIYLLKHRPATVAARVNQLAPDDTLGMSFVTWAELLKGAEQSTRRVEVMRQLGQLARQIPVRYLTSHALCEHYARHAVRLRAAGTPIGGNDLWIASHALADNSVLVTNNEREFSRIEGLAIENWATLPVAG